MQELAKDVLRLSKEENNSNEAAITCDFACDNPLEEFGVVLGTEHEVDILADTFLNHILNDLSYHFEPLKLFQPKPDYKVDEED